MRIGNHVRGLGLAEWFAIYIFSLSIEYNTHYRYTCVKYSTLTGFADQQMDVGLLVNMTL